MTAILGSNTFMGNPCVIYIDSTGSYGNTVLRVPIRCAGHLELELACKLDQCRKRIGLHLSHNVPTMDLDGVFGDPQLEGCLLVQQTSCQKRKDLPFARCQGFIPSN